MSLFQELKRRNVFRVGTAYIVAAWLVIQVVETIFPAFGFGDIAIRVIVIIFAVGLVPVLILAWVFELTPEGLKKEVEVDRSQSITPRTGRKLDHIIMVVLALAVGYFLFDRAILSPQRETEIEQSAHKAGGEQALAEAAAARANQSIVVLPFVDMSRDQNQAYFSDGLAEELLNLLSRIPELRVISRTSAFSFKGKDVAISEIAEQLNVAHVLEGSVRVDGQRLRITTQLINARDDVHVWSQNFDRELTDIFSIQDEIAALVVKQMKVTLLGDVPEAQKVDPEAYALYLEARNLRYNNFTAEAIESSVEILKQSLSIDADYAPAWCSLGRAYFLQIHNGLRDMEDGMFLSRSAVDKALQLDPNYAPAHALMANLALKKSQLPEAARHLEHAIEIEPTSQPVVQQGALLLQSLGRFDEAARIMERFWRLDPVNAGIYSELGLNSMFARRLEEAEQYFRQGVLLQPNSLWGETMLAYTMACSGKYEEAQEILLSMENSFIKSAIETYIYRQLGMTDLYQKGLATIKSAEGGKPDPDLARYYAQLGEIDAVFERLEIGYENEGANFWDSREHFWPSYWQFDNDPRWQSFLEKTGVSDAQLSKIKFEITLPQE